MTSIAEPRESPALAARLLDADSFVETGSGALACGRNGSGDTAYGDGVNTGFGTVDGRPACAPPQMCHRPRPAARHHSAVSAAQP